MLYPFLVGHKINKQINKVAKRCATNGVRIRGDCNAEMRKGWMRMSTSVVILTQLVGIADLPRLASRGRGIPLKPRGGLVFCVIYNHSKFTLTHTIHGC